jgi:hypothetical protein
LQSEPQIGFEAVRRIETALSHRVAIADYSGYSPHSRPANLHNKPCGQKTRLSVGGISA